MKVPKSVLGETYAKEIFGDKNRDMTMRRYRVKGIKYFLVELSGRASKQLDRMAEETDLLEKRFSRKLSEFLSEVIFITFIIKDFLPEEFYYSKIP